MIKNITKALTLVACFGFGVSANASLIETDFLSTGDGLLFVDTETNYEWIDVAKTTNMSVNDFFNSSIYSGQGFQLAVQDDLYELYDNAGATDISLDSNQVWTVGNLPAAQLLAGLMEHSSPYTQTSSNSWIHGYMDSGSTSLTLSRFNAFGGSRGASFGINTNGVWSYDSHHSQIGVWAFRATDPSAVPEPATLALFGIGLAGLGFARKKKKSA